MGNEDNLTNKPEENIELQGKEDKQSISEETQDDLSFVEMYEQSLQDVPTGKIVTGKVVQIGEDVVMVDVGYKTEGRVNVNELKDDEGNMTVAVGDEIEVFVNSKKEDDLILSRRKAVKMKVWDDIMAACEAGGILQGKIVDSVKGGLTVDIGFMAFLPGSQVDLYPVKDLNKFIGQTMDFKVLKYDKKRNNVVLSRKAILEEEYNKKKQQLLETIEEGAVVEGVVKNITDYGLFVDLGGIDGLLHITDISWGRIRHPSEKYAKGDVIKVKILNYDKEKERVSLGVKQLTGNPWDDIDERYREGSIVEGKLVSLTDYGAFVEIEPGVEGLVHVSEMFWTKKVKHPSSILSVGDTVKVMVLGIDSENKRISLGLKQTQTNPWEELKDKYPEGTIIKAKIRNVADFGIFVGIEKDIDGLIHVSDISWRKRVKHPSELYKKGQEIEAVVLNIDVENEKFSLGIKQLENNPWEELDMKYGVGSAVSGKITNITDFGVFVEIEEGIEGLVHVSELGQKKGKTPEEQYAVGDVVYAVVKNIDSKSQKVGLSIKDYESASNAPSVKQYVNNKEKVVSNLGDLLSGMKM